MTTVEITNVGNSAGIVLPEEVLSRLRVNKGDKLQVVETPNGIVLTPCDREFAEQLAVAEQIMDADRDVLTKLAE